MRKLALLAPLVLAATFAAPSALADATPAVVTPGWNGEALLSYGFHDGVAFGLGARAGYTLENPMGLYLGGTLQYHFGSNYVNVYYLGFEAGYDIAAGPVIVRPYLGIGPAWVHADVPAIVAVGPVGVATTNVSNTDSEFAFWPGATVAYPINEKFFVGGDARIFVVSNLNTFVLSAMGGMYF